MTTEKPQRDHPLIERMARTIISNAQGEYSDEEIARVRDAMENRPDELGGVLSEIHAAHGKGGVE